MKITKTEAELFFFLPYMSVTGIWSLFDKTIEQFLFRWLFCIILGVILYNILIKIFKKNIIQ